MMVKSRLAGLVSALVMVAGLVVVFGHPALPWSQSLHFEVAAGQFGQMDLGSYVEINGVKVGKVDSIRYENGRGLLGISVDPRYGHLLHRDASASIQPHSLLGPTFVELKPGSRGRLPNGATITHTAISTSLDQVLSALQPDVRSNLQVTFIELGTAAAGRGQDLNTAFAALGQSADHLRTVTATVRSQDPALAGLISNSEILDRDVQKAPVGAQIQDTDRVLSGLAQVDTALGGSIDHTAAVARELDTIMAGNPGNLSLVLIKAPGAVKKLEAFLVPGGQLVGGIGPGLPALMTAIMESKSFLAGADGNGHYVKILALGGACSAGGAPSPSCGGQFDGFSGGNAIVPASSGGGAPLVPAPGGSGSASPGRGGLTDQELIHFVLGS